MSTFLALPMPTLHPRTFRALPMPTPHPRTFRALRMPTPHPRRFHKHLLPSLMIACALSGTGASAATLENVRGEILVSQGDGFQPAKGSVALQPGDLVVAGPGSRAAVNYGGGCNITVTPGALITVKEKSPCRRPDPATTDKQASIGQPAMRLMGPDDAARHGHAAANSDSGHPVEDAEGSEEPSVEGEEAGAGAGGAGAGGAGAGAGVGAGAGLGGLSVGTLVAIGGLAAVAAVGALAVSQNQASP